MLRWDGFVRYVEFPALWPEGAGLPERPPGPSLSDGEALADHIDREAHMAKVAWAIRSVVPPVTRIIEDGRTRIRVHPEAKAALASLDRRERRVRMRRWRESYRIAFQVEAGLAEPRTPPA
ncbi:MAG: hypothetical protein ACRDIZ_12025 [Actinomycetota bacterium]